MSPPSTLPSDLRRSGSATSRDPISRTVPIHLVQRTLRTARHRGVNIPALLRAAGIRDLLVDSPRSRVTVEQMTRLTQTKWRLSEDELFGLGPRPVPRGTFRLLMMATIHSPDLGTLLRRLSEHARALPSFPAVELTVGPQLTRLQFDTSGFDDPEALLVDTAVATGHRLIGWVIGRRVALLELDLPYPSPARVADYDLIFGFPPRFGSGVAGLAFSSALLTAPIVRTEDDLTQFLRDSPAGVLSRRDFGTMTADQVRAILERGLTRTWPTSEEVASRLATSLQHLRRKLREEGTSVSQIKEELLRDAAIASLARGEESIAALAERLGFSEPRAFRRAFVRWTGSAPRSYRPDLTE